MGAKPVLTLSNYTETNFRLSIFVIISFLKLVKIPNHPVHSIVYDFVPLSVSFLG